LDCYSVFSPLQAYFLPIQGNEEVLVLGKLPYAQSGNSTSTYVISGFLLRQSDGNTNFISIDFFSNTNLLKDEFV
jgi:hypothetical protein